MSCNESTCKKAVIELQCRQNFFREKKGATRLEFHAATVLRSHLQYSLFTAATQALSHLYKKTDVTQRCRTHVILRDSPYLIVTIQTGSGI